MVGVHDKMNLSLIDWAIVFAVLGGMFYSVSTTKGLMKSVSDFLAAGRTAGRYVISISSGIAGLGAIQPVLVAIEDLHWADPLALAHMAAMTSVVRDCPAVLLMTSRSRATHWIRRGGTRSTACR